MRLLKDPEEKFDEYDEKTGVKILREIVKARLVGKVVMCTLPAELREQLGITAGSRLMITFDRERKALVITKE